jgi:hypothetical protein
MLKVYMIGQFVCIWFKVTCVRITYLYVTYLQMTYL